MTDRVTLYRVRRQDGTVIGHEFRAGNETDAILYACEFDGDLRRLWWLEDMSIPELRDRGYTVEAVEYAPVNPEREAAIKMMRDALGKVYVHDCYRSLVKDKDEEDQCECPQCTVERSIDAFDKADGAK